MRLNIVSEELVTQLSNCSVEKQRFLSLLVCKAVLKLNHVENMSVESAVNFLEKNHFLTNQQRNELDHLVAELDNQYFELQENPANEDSEVRTLLYFGQARAISALSFAGMEDAFIAVSEAIYEALKSIDDRDVILTLVKNS